MTKNLVTETVEEVRKDNVTTLAASLAYFAVFSIVPAVVLLITVGGAFLGEEATREEVLAQLHMWIGVAGVNFVDQAIEHRAESGAGGVWATVISAGLLLIGATRFFAELQFALNMVWEVEPRREKHLLELLRKRALSVVLILFLVVYLIASVIASALGAALAKYAMPMLPGKLVSWETINFVLSFWLGWGLLTLLLKFFPDARIRFRDVIPGAALTTLALVLAKFGFGYYLGRAAFASTYGAAGSILAFLVFVYLSSNILLIGAEFTQVWARNHGQKIIPETHAKRVRRRWRARKEREGERLEEEPVPTGAE